MSTTTRRPATTRAHRARIAADAMPVLVVQTLVLGGVWASAIVVSFTGLVAAAGWANINGGQRFGVPVFIDGILVGASIAYLVARERHDRASAVIALGAMAGFAGLSIMGNATHALAGTATGVQRITGVALAVAAPLAVLVTTELLARTVIAPPPPPKVAPAPAVARAAAEATAVTIPTPAAAEAISRPARRVTTPRPTPALGADRDAQRAEVTRLVAEGLSRSAIADAVGVPLSTVKRWATAAPASEVVAV
ncbi:helix-turn-helix domain-containing protein [Cellulomonas soli]|uniref:Homeodomain-like domain-containing protein n=1 Tax=Cellulomonas soli TaxID=931535 RepID=A0A512PHH0_9CELL|nr:helix-turn-helix domain-containing protein [Cellulomonas soli]NYI59165.1 hypothetical protein [Cellulomonas soli]GEP70669.1 hypothetical protein CSO01_33840 [Cellulomonas soli]